MPGADRKVKYSLKKFKCTIAKIVENMTRYITKGQPGYKCRKSRIGDRVGKAIGKAKGKAIGKSAADRALGLNPRKGRSMAELIEKKSKQICYCRGKPGLKRTYFKCNFDKALQRCTNTHLFLILCHSFLIIYHSFRYPIQVDARLGTRRGQKG